MMDRDVLSAELYSTAACWCRCDDQGARSSDSDQVLQLSLLQISSGGVAWSRDSSGSFAVWRKCADH